MWSCDISEKTRTTIWKYLQLTLFSIVGTVNNREAFGDSAKLFETINEDEFKGKLEETLEQMKGIFENNGGDDTGSSSSSEEFGQGKAKEIHEHITGMLDGKLGKLAREIAEETAGNMNLDMDGVTDAKGVFQSLMKNPGKLMGLVKNVGDKLDNRIKSGEIKESELISEASELIQKMKNMPVMGDIQSILSKMGMGGAKLNVNGMEAKLNQDMKSAKNRERMREKAESNRIAKDIIPPPSMPSIPAFTDEQLLSAFESPKTSTQQQSQPKKKGKKGKK